MQHAAAAAQSLQLCPTLCDPIDGSPPGSPVPGILQARTLECMQHEEHTNKTSVGARWPRGGVHFGWGLGALPGTASVEVLSELCSGG